MSHMHISHRFQSNEQLLEELRRIATLLKTPTFWSTDFQKHSKIPRSKIHQRFGTWAEALECAGLGHMRPGCIGYSDEELLGELRRVAGLLQQSTVSIRDYKNHGKIPRPAFYQRFGGWLNALESACLRDSHRTRLSEEEVLEELRRVASLLGKPTLTFREYANHGKVTRRAICRRFGAWMEALERAA